ncbi:MAG: dihydrodipicolinate synthase family protein [Planctomycetes bacterium]|nr:dihydrodipicolinate synthase family protein [Planctomycetota bacterium]
MSAQTHIEISSKKPAHLPLAEILARLIENVMSEKNDKPHFLIAVGGPGGTGKSTFCQQLSHALKQLPILTLDDYKTPRQERADKNLFGAHPEANHIELIQEHLSALKRGENIKKPVYNSVTGEADETEIFSAGPVIILDGEISTYEEFRQWVDFSIFIDSDWKTQLNTRITRDITEREYSPDKAISTFLQSNLREFTEHGAKSKSWADVHLFCHGNYQLELESVARPIFPFIEQIREAHLRTISFAGLITPLCTPFKANGDLDEKAFITHLGFLAESGVSRILLCGTSGEFFSLLPKERQTLLQLARMYFPGVIFFQSGSESLLQTQEQSQWAEDLGADGLFILPPFYLANLPQEGLTDYFNTLAQGLSVPMFLYNFPQHTQNSISAEMLGRIEHFGLKDSAADLSLIGATSHYYVGGDGVIMEAITRGASGFVSGHANYAPELYLEMEDQMKVRDPARYAAIQTKINHMREPSRGKSLVYIKERVAELIPGYPTGVRLPLLSLA